MPTSWTASTANYPWVKTYTASTVWIHECIFKDCPTCPDFVKAKTEPLDERVVGVCLRGVAWKVLIKYSKQRKCTKKRREQNE